MEGNARPGADWVRSGIDDLRNGRHTIAGWLVSIGAPRLRKAGVDVPHTFADPEHGLYALLSREDADSAHGRYNALLRRLVSYERSLPCGG